MEQIVQLNPDGSVYVSDTRTLTALGGADFGEAFICIQLKEGQQVTLMSGSGGLGAGPGTTAFVQECKGGQEVVVKNEQRLRERRVRFVYQLHGSVDFYTDVVQWYWNILERSHPSIYGYSLSVYAPGTMAEPYDAYVHRYANEELPVVNLSDDRRVLTVQFNRIYDGDGVEVRYLMDPGLFDPLGTRPGFEELLRDEARVAGLRSLNATRRNPAWGFVPLGLLAMLGSLIGVQHARVGREPRTSAMKHPFEPPSDLPPAAVAELQNQQPNVRSYGPIFHSTLMDLMRRGYGEFRPRNRHQVDILLNVAKPVDNLLPFEQQVLDYLLKAAALDPEVAALTRQAQLPKEILLRHEYLRIYSVSSGSRFRVNLGNNVRKWLLEQRGGSLTTLQSQAVANRWSRVTLAAAAVPVGLAFFNLGPARALMIVGAVLMVILAVSSSSFLRAWRPEIAQELAEWRGFKRTLTSYTRMKHAPLDFYKLWDVYYVYAAALGVAKKYLKTLEKAAPAAGVDQASMVRSAGWMGVANSVGASSLSSLSRSISSLSSSLSSASASASSGGSSSGGGGGGGGGSSGGR